MSLIKERPILFSSAMVRAILDGTKTQTRRVIKLRKDSIVDLFDDDYLSEKGFCGFDTENFHNRQVKCPFGKVGDLLWVRETWADVTSAFNDADEIRHAAFKADESVYDVYGQIQYLEKLGDSGIYVDKWKPSIFMPRFASRIALEITNIRVEQIQQISLEDSEAEGIRAFHDAEKLNGDCSEFIKLWNEINSKRGFSWESNPFVWVIEFQRVEVNQ